MMSSIIYINHNKWRLFVQDENSIKKANKKFAGRWEAA